MSAEVAAGWIADWEGPQLVTDPYLSRFGISIKYHPTEDIRNMTRDRAIAIFLKEYWPAGADGLPDYLAIPLMSFSVVEGATQAVYALQRALVVKVDGDIGNGTIAAAAATLANRDRFLVAFGRACRKRFAESPRWILDGEGWEARQMAASLAAKVWAS